MIDALELAGAFVLGFLIAVAVASLLVKALLDLYRDEVEVWRSERRELLNRIQHPERMPVATVRQESPQAAAQRSAAAARLRELNHVGRVVQTDGSADMELP
jgi:hypothetical protein